MTYQYCLRCDLKSNLECDLKSNLECDLERV